MTEQLEESIGYVNEEEFNRVVVKATDLSLQRRLGISSKSKLPSLDQNFSREKEYSLSFVIQVAQDLGALAEDILHAARTELKKHSKNQTFLLSKVVNFLTVSLPAFCGETLNTLADSMLRPVNPDYGRISLIERPAISLAPIVETDTIVNPTEELSLKERSYINNLYNPINEIVNSAKNYTLPITEYLKNINLLIEKRLLVNEIQIKTDKMPLYNFY